MYARYYEYCYCYMRAYVLCVWRDVCVSVLGQIAE